MVSMRANQFMFIICRMEIVDGGSLCVVHARIQKVLSGGGGGPTVTFFFLS